MKKNIVIILLIFFSLKVNLLFAEYNIDISTYNGIGQSIVSPQYNLKFGSFGDNFTDTSIGNNYRLSTGFVSSLDSYFLPRQMDIVGKKAFVQSLNSNSVETAVLQILDFDSGPVKYEQIIYSIIDKPLNAFGDTLSSTITDDSGLSYLSFKTGDKTGAYIVKSVYSDFPPLYLGYHTDETVVPAKEWRMIGINKIPVSPEIENVFTSVKPEYLYHWYPEEQTHELYNKYREPKKLVAGEGYYIILPSETILKINGNYVQDTLTVQLKTGWNQIGSPYYCVTSWSNCRILTSAGRLTAADAELQGYIQNKIFYYKDNAYVWGPNSALLNPMLYVWSGFWIYANKECSLELSPDFSYIENSRVNLAPKKTVPSDNIWEVILSVKGDKSSDLINMFGITNVDPVSETVRKAPGIPELLSVNFQNNGNNLASDKRIGPIETCHQWLCGINTGNNSRLSLSFNGINSISEKYDIYLIDLKTKKNYNLKELPELNIECSKYESLSYRVVAGLPEYVRMFLAPPLSKENTFVSPNPLKSPGNTVNFVYSAPLAGTLNLKIFDLAGVKVIDRNIDLNSNPYQWDCRNDAGKLVSSGIYIYILEYKNNNENYKLIDKLAIIR
ncbi:T9SS type A sorting domain-containing protein [Candidatus Dependentiae bacterium]|nr:T9SS type A sorting domain-containing protein [Candidatus Dependentiae bacterium]